MNQNDVTQSSKIQPEESTDDIGRTAAGAAKAAGNIVADSVEGAADFIEDAAGRATDAVKCRTGMAKACCRSTVLKFSNTMTASKNFVRRNPMGSVLGALTCGAALGCAVMMGRHNRSWVERAGVEALSASRSGILGVFAPVRHRLHQGYDSARDGAGKAMAHLHCMRSKRSSGSIPDHICRMAHNLKFW